MKSRHAVRNFTDRKIEGEVEDKLRKTVDECNKDSGLRFQLFLNEPKAFGSKLSNYGRFKNCKNYLALAGPRGMDEKYGYYGEKVVLKAQQLGINSCWVGLTYHRSKVLCNLDKGENIRLVIALGYGVTQGVAHKSKDMMKLCKVDGEMPQWFREGMEAALLAPTAVNQQRFLMILKGNVVTAKALPAFYSKVDLGIVKYHFEIGAGIHNFKWG